MESVLSSYSAWAAGTVLVVSLLAVVFLTPKKYAREPPYMPSSVPIIGHLIGISTIGADHFEKLYAKYQQPVFTVPILNGKMYIAASSAVAQSVQRNWKTIAFGSLVRDVMKHVFLYDEPTLAVFDINVNGAEGHHGFWPESHTVMGNVLARGAALDDLNRTVLDRLLPLLNGLANHGPEQLNLWSWLRHNFSLASSAAIWGPAHPFMLDQSLVDDFWVLEPSFPAFLLLPFPALTARKPYLARKRLMKAYRKYTDTKGYEQASQLIKARYQLHEKYGVADEMKGRNELGMLTGALTNAIPSSFWLTSYIFRDPSLLASIRAEVDACITTSIKPTKRTINASKLTTNCPLYSSTFRESLRVTAPVAVNRKVVADTFLPNPATGEQVLLKEGNMCVISTNAIHFNPEIWGQDAHAFDPRRFLVPIKSESNSGTEIKEKYPDPARPTLPAKLDRGAFRPFGGGNNLCPGRHFAQTEILAFTALLVAGFEISAADGGPYVPPEFEKGSMHTATLKPEGDVRVRIRRREGFDSVEWEFEL